MPTKAQAIDHLVDVLAGDNVVTTGTTAQRIMQLADLIEDGEISIGGGGGKQDVCIVLSTQLTIDESETTTHDAHAVFHCADKIVDALSQPVVMVTEDTGYVPTAPLALTFNGSVANALLASDEGDYIEVSYLSCYLAAYIADGEYSYHAYLGTLVNDEASGYIASENTVEFDPTDIAADGSLTINFTVTED